MAIAYVGEVLQDTYNGAGASSINATVDANAGAGQLLVLRVASTNQIISGITDSRGNTWTLIDSGVLSLGFGMFWTLQDVGTLLAGDTVTMTWPGNVFEYAVVIDEFSGIAATNPLDVFATATGSGTARAAGTTAATSQADELVCGGFSANVGSDSFTPGLGYSSPSTPSLSNGSAVSVEGEYQIVSSTGTQQATGTGTSANWVGITATFKASASNPPLVGAQGAIRRSRGVAW